MPASRLVASVVLTVVLMLTGCKASVPIVDLVDHDEIAEEETIDVLPLVMAPNLSLLVTNLQEYLDRQEGTYGICVLDVLSGEAIGINTNMVFPAASTIKLPMVMYILNQVASGQDSLDEQLTYTEDDWEDGTGYLQSLVEEGDSFAVRELIDYAIRFSDNIATNMLLRRFGLGQVYTYMQSLGGTVTLFDSTTNGTTPQEMVAYMYAARANDTANEGLRLLLLDYLAETVFEDRVRAGVPPEVRVEHKIGTLPGVVNDVAFVYGNRPFVLAVFSIDVAEDDAVSVIAEVAARTYAFLNDD